MFLTPPTRTYAHTNANTNADTNADTKTGTNHPRPTQVIIFKTYRWGFRLRGRP